ncbi:MAG: immunoglobulin domain-containing protein [Bacteroidales bacterium]|nr:immunoglobulin domain-containing protein [Bacteroidales bacterium]
MKHYLLILSVFFTTLLFAQDLQWVKDLSETDPDNLTVVDIEEGPNGYIYVLANFTGTIDIAAGSTEFNVSSYGGNDFFVAKYTASGQFYSVFHGGNDGWLGTATSSDEYAYDMDISSSGNIYFTGSFESNMYFQPYDHSSDIYCNCSQNMFVAELNQNLAYQWVSTPYDCYEDMEQTMIEGQKIFYYSPNDEILVAGQFTGDISFTSSSSVNSSDEDMDLFFTKLEGNGTFDWGKAIKSTSTGKTESVTGIFVHPDYEYIYLAGSFEGTIDMDPGTGAINVTSNGYHDIFMGFYSSSGTAFSSIYYGQIGSATVSDFCTDMDMDSYGNVYISSSVYTNKTVDIDIKSSVTNVSAGSGNDSYIAKYNYLLNLQDFLQISGNENNSIEQFGIDQDDLICLQGWYYGTANFNPKGTSYNMSASASTIDMIIGKYYDNFEKLVVQSIGNADANLYQSMVLGANKHSSNMIIFGKYVTTTDFDGGIGESYITPNDYFNGRYLAKYSHCQPSNISLQPSTSSSCEGTDVGLSLSASGTNLSYQWYKNNTAISDGYTAYGGVLGSTSNSLSISGINENTDDLYKCIVSSSCDNALTSNQVAISVVLKPEITSNPTNVTNCEGNNANFSVVATGYNLSYQWLVNDGSGSFQTISDNATYSGSQTGSLTVSNIQPSQSYYQYKCMVSGDCSPNTFSNPALLIVNPNPNIQSHPQDDEVCEGDNANFSVSTSGNGLSYQWQRSTDGVNYSTISDNVFYSGSNTSSLTITAITLGFNNYSYRCIVSGTCGSSITSNSGTIIVNENASISSQPSNVEICEYENTTFNINASGYGLSYRWQVNNGGGWVNLNNGGYYSNVNSPSLNITYAGTSLDGYLYRCMVSSSCSGTSYSYSAELTVASSPDITVYSSNGNDFCEGQTTDLWITGGSVEYIYQWKRNYSAIIGGTNDEYSTAQSGIYSIYAENAIGCSYESDPITINVHALPNATVSVIGNSTFCEGAYAELLVPSGNGYSYQWMEQNSPIIGATDNTFIATESGIYNVSVTNTFGCSSNSSTTQITVNPLPEINITPIGNVAICYGEEEALTADLNTDYIYQWKYNNINISGANNNTYSVSESGLYNLSLINTNTGCSSTSPYITVVVNPLPQPVISSSDELTYCVNDYTTLSLNTSYNSYIWDDLSTGNTLVVNTGGNYQVTVTDNNGCQNTTSIEINEDLVPTPNICMVTVDTSLNKNLIVWENMPDVTGIASYNVYKLVNSSYQLIGNVLYNDTTEFVDLTSEPDVHSDQYSIASVDSCGNIGAYSPFHQTMNLSIVDGSGSSIALIWTKYIDEAGINNPSEYEIYRGYSTLSYFSSITGGLSDYNVNIATPLPDERFIIVVQRPLGCAPLNNEAKANGGPYYQSTSNIEDEGIIATKINTLVSNNLNIYPNPATSVLNIQSDKLIQTIEVFDVIGKKVLTLSDIMLTEIQIDISSFKNGAYTLRINGQVLEKIILQ